jgi:hypothetical protein
VPGFFVPSFLVACFGAEKRRKKNSGVFVRGEGLKTRAALPPVLCLFEIMRGNGVRED